MPNGVSLATLYWPPGGSTCSGFFTTCIRRTSEFPSDFLLVHIKNAKKARRVRGVSAAECLTLMSLSAFVAQAKLKESITRE